MKTSTTHSFFIFLILILILFNFLLFFFFFFIIFFFIFLLFLLITSGWLEHAFPIKLNSQNVFQLETFHNILPLFQVIRRAFHHVKSTGELGLFNVHLTICGRFFVLGWLSLLSSPCFHLFGSARASPWFALKVNYARIRLRSETQLFRLVWPQNTHAYSLTCLWWTGTSNVQHPLFFCQTSLLISSTLALHPIALSSSPSCFPSIYSSPLLHLLLLLLCCSFQSPTVCIRSMLHPNDVLSDLLSSSASAPLLQTLPSFSLFIAAFRLNRVCSATFHERPKQSWN